MPAAAAGAVNGTASKHMLSHIEGVLFGARCLDGSNYGYYLSQASNSSKWVVYMEGGGYCATSGDCHERAKTPLGSSTMWHETYALKGITSNDAVENPDFWEWNKVIIRYCTGDLHSGRKMSPTYDDLYFSGHLNFARTLQVLRNKHGLSEASEVLLTGASAGGLGTLNNLDWLAQQMAPVPVSGAPQAGWFLDVVPFTDKVIPIELASEIGYMVWDGFIDTDCVAAMSKRPWFCYSGNYSFPYISTRLMVIEGQYDTNQLYVQDGAPQGNYTQDVCSYINKFGHKMLDSLQQVAARNSSGLFLVSCLTHGVAFDTVRIGGYSWQQVIGNWYFHRQDEPTKLVDNCHGAAVPCNPTCGQPVHVCTPYA